jgi:hypothetical protein
MTDESISRGEMVLSVQRALLGNVTSNLRGVAVDWDDRIIRVVCYYHGPISDADKELMNCVHTEIATDFVDRKPVELVTERIDMPTKLIGPESVIRPEKRLTHRGWVFLRKE